MIWTDTFANNRQSSIFSTTLGENNARLVELNRQDIRVIIGNPPYSVGQDNANDDNQNEHYDELDDRIAKTYAAKTEAVNKNSLYDSYIRAYRWASDRIGNKGIIGFVTNAGWIDSNSADGMRKCLTEEFSSIYVYHLKGNQRTSGERSRQEGGKVFGEGSRAPVAIVFLVKNPASTERGKIFFHSVDDYLTREEKLACLREDRSMAYTSCSSIVLLPPSSPPAHLSFFPSTRRALPMDSFSLTVTLRAASHVHPVTARKHPKREQKFQPRSAIPVISRSMPLLNKLLNSIPIRTTTIWSALIVPNATAVTSKA